MKFSQLYLHVILLILLSMEMTAQESWDKIRGSWVRYKLERKDGSTYLDRNVADTSYVNCVITKGDFTFHTDPVKRYRSSPVSYLFKDPEIIFKKNYRMLIEHLSKDTLVISEISDRTDDMASRQYLVREQVVCQSCFNASADKHRIVATKFCAPTLKAPIHYDIPWTFKKNQPNFLLSGAITLNLRERTATTSFKNPQDGTADIIAKIRKTFDKSYSSWALNKFAQFTEVVVPFSIRYINETTNKDVIVEYVTQEEIDGPEVYRRESLRVKTGVDLYNHAVDAYKVKDYEKAAELYLKCYEADPFHLEAVYLAGDIYRQLRKTDKACAAWRLLADRGQVNAQKLISQYCNTNE